MEPVIRWRLPSPARIGEAVPAGAAALAQRLPGALLRSAETGAAVELGRGPAAA